MNVGIRVGKEWIELDDILPGVVPSQLVITCDLDPYRRRLFKASALAQFYGRKSCSQLARKIRTFVQDVFSMQNCAFDAKELGIFVCDQDIRKYGIAIPKGTFLYTKEIFKELLENYENKSGRFYDVLRLLPSILNPKANEQKNDNGEDVFNAPKNDNALLNEIFRKIEKQSHSQTSIIMDSAFIVVIC